MQVGRKTYMLQTIKQQMHHQRKIAPQLSAASPWGILKGTTHLQLLRGRYSEKMF
jgi:hypothetical protein